MKFFLSSLLLLSFGNMAHATCQTAFAYCAKNVTTGTNPNVPYTQCFDKTSPSFKRWGWVHNQTTANPAITCTLYAGAAGCDRTKGAIVGTATITSRTFTITLDSAWEYALAPLSATDEGSTVVHFYHGQKMYPLTGGTTGMATVAPGKYDAGYQTRQDGVYTIQGDPLNPGLLPKDYFILHASVCPAVSPFASSVTIYIVRQLILTPIFPSVSKCIAICKTIRQAVGCAQRNAKRFAGAIGQAQRNAKRFAEAIGQA